MSWTLALLGSCLLFVQAARTEPTSPSTVPGIVVEIGYFPMHGLWYQDGVDHVHDKVRVRPVYRPDGSIEVTIGTTAPGGTDITIQFSHDATGQTHAAATALFRSDVRTNGEQKTWHLSELEGRIVVQTNDWGPGKTLNALFAIRGKEGKTVEFLVGSFSILLRQ